MHAQFWFEHAHIFCAVSSSECSVVHQIFLYSAVPEVAQKKKMTPFSTLKAVQGLPGG
jgi:hypothetical protein